MVRDRPGTPEADDPWDDRPRPGYEFDSNPYPIRYTPKVTGAPQPLAEDRPGFEFDGPFPLAHRRTSRPSPAGRPAEDTTSAHAEWSRLLHAHRAEPRQTVYQRFRANLRFRGWALRVAVPIAAMTAVGVAVVVVTGANSGAGGGAAPGNATTLGFPPATLAGHDFAADLSSRGVTLELGRVASDGPEVVAVGAETGTVLPRAEFFISRDAGIDWSLAPESGATGGAPPPGHAPRLIAGGAGGWVALGPDSIWTSGNGAVWTLRSTTGLPGVTVLRRTAAGFLAAGPAGIYLSATGTSWQRVPAPAGALLLRYAAASGTRIVLAGEVTGGMSGAWLSSDGGRGWTPVPVPFGHGATAQIAGVAAVPGGFALVRPARVDGRPSADVYRSADGVTWKFAAALAGFTPTAANGGPDGAVVAGAGAAYTSPDGTRW